VIKDFLGCHVEMTRNAMKAWNYCGKKDTRIEGPLESGCPPAARNVKGDKAAQNKMLMELGVAEAVEQGIITLQQGPGVQKGIDLVHGTRKNLPKFVPFENEWHYGGAGLGKSSTLRERYPDAYIKNANQWWCHYKGQETVLIEDIGPKCIGAQKLKTWADHYPFSCEAKGSTLKIRPKRILITSNWSIREIYPDHQDYEAIERRF